VNIISADTPINGPLIVIRRRYEDERGSIDRLFALDEITRIGLNYQAVHINITRTTHVGTIKGLHMQKAPHEEMKLITCITGRIFDVAVDLRRKSPTYGRWFGSELSPDKPESLLIPEGFAHGMQCLEPNSVVHYVHSAAYCPRSELGVNPLDPDVAVDWPLPPRYISQRDKLLPWFADLGEF
jgi:dTDP-4-dehydrorhamnose 3,5-epimerase